jgi:hypothetical protein
VTDVRNALEHLDASVVSGNAGFGYGIGGTGCSLPTTALDSTLLVCRFWVE